MTLRAFFITAACACVLQSCGLRERTDAPEQESGPQPRAEEPDKAPTMPANVPQGSMQKEGGVFTVLGLEIPKEMKPAKGPAKIFRFSGVLPVAQLTELMRDQIRPKWSKKSGSGHLFEEARVRSPKGRSSGKDLLNVRVFKGPEGGSVLDIWIAHSASGASTEEIMRATSVLGPSTVQKEKRTKKKADTLRTMNKAAKGQKFTESDRNSPYFH